MPGSFIVIPVLPSIVQGSNMHQHLGGGGGVECFRNFFCVERAELPGVFPHYPLFIWRSGRKYFWQYFLLHYLLGFLKILLEMHWLQPPPPVTDLYPAQPGTAAARRVGISIHTPGDDVVVSVRYVWGHAWGLPPYSGALLIGNSLRL